MRTGRARELFRWIQERETWEPEAIIAALPLPGWSPDDLKIGVVFSDGSRTISFPGNTKMQIVYDGAVWKLVENGPEQE
jgi:hypothetical protein